MFYRRKLPHWHPEIAEATFLFVTWRLAGSMPQCKPPQPPRAAPISDGRAFLALDREADKAVLGPVWLRDARVAQVVADALLYGESGRQFYEIEAWVIMPNHVHVLLRPQHISFGDYPLAERIHGTKGQPDPGPDGAGVLAG